MESANRGREFEPWGVAMRRCPYCGEKIQVGVERCEHCGKTLVKKRDEPQGKPGLTNLDSWQQKRIPSWVMYLVCLGLLFCVALMVAKGCEGKPGNKRQDDAKDIAKVEPAGSQLPVAGRLISF